MRWVRALGGLLSVAALLVSVMMLLQGGWAGIAAIAGVLVFVIGLRHTVTAPIGRRQTLRGTVALAVGLAVAAAVAGAMGAIPAAALYAAMAIVAVALAIYAARVVNRVRRPMYADYFKS